MILSNSPNGHNRAEPHDAHRYVRYLHTTRLVRVPLADPETAQETSGFFDSEDRGRKFISSFQSQMSAHLRRSHTECLTVRSVTSMGGEGRG